MDTLHINDAENIYIQYTIQDDNQISTLKFSLKDIENGKLYFTLQNTENFTCCAKVLKRKLMINEKKDLLP